METIVDGALLAVGQHRVSFGGLFELFFGVRIVRVAVGMKLKRQLSIGTLDFLVSRRAGYTQHLVIIAFSVTSQNGRPNPFSCSMSSVLGVACDLYHRGTQQTIFQLVASLQLLEVMMILGLGRVYHLDGLVKMRIKRLTLSWDRTQSQF